MGVSENRGTPKSSISIGFSMIFTIHFGVPPFTETPKLMGAPVLFGEGNFFLKELRVLWTWKVDHEDGEEAHEISNHRL